MVSRNIKFDTRIVAPGVAGISEAAELLKKGEVVGIPTETVYGLAANCFDKSAINKIYLAKGRPSDNPIIVHVSSLEQVDFVARRVSRNAKKLMQAFWPGPLTLVMKKTSAIPTVVTAGLDTVAVRMPDHHVAQAIIQLAGVPLAAPSANLSGKPSPTSAQSVMDDLKGSIPLIVDGGPCNVGIESTVVDVTSEIPQILRPGMITAEMIREVTGDVVVDTEVHEEVRSPGVKYAHYQPNAKLTIFYGPQAAVSREILFRINQDELNDIKSGVMCFEQTKRNYSGEIILLGSRFNLIEVAQNLYNSLRKADELELKNVYVESLDDREEGTAIMNRLIRAAGGNVEVI
jgi:L-threonylcarbamoyladenylate synthase